MRPVETSMARGLKLSYSMGVFPGAFGLARAGMTYVGPQAEHAGLPVFPHVLWWLRP